MQPRLGGADKRLNGKGGRTRAKEGKKKKFISGVGKVRWVVFLAMEAAGYKGRRGPKKLTQWLQARCLARIDFTLGRGKVQS